MRPGAVAMDPKGLGAGVGQVASGLAADSRSLEQLKRAARDDPRQAVKKVATQFEALFMQMVLKSMREATPRSGLLDSQEQDMVRGMLDQQVAEQIAGRGTGLSELIARQLARNLPSEARSAKEGPPPADAAAPSAPPVSAPPAQHAAVGLQSQAAVLSAPPEAVPSTQAQREF